MLGERQENVSETKTCNQILMFLKLMVYLRKKNKILANRNQKIMFPERSWKQKLFAGMTSFLLIFFGFVRVLNNTFAIGIFVLLFILLPSIS